MAGEQENPKKNLNPNWIQLLKTLKSNGSKTQISKHTDSLHSVSEGSTLGKRKERLDDDSPASKPNSFLPTSSDCGLTDVLAMDCEMVGVSSSGNKSALGRVTMVNKWGNVVYDEYVRPVEYVVDFRTQISGIRPHDLRKGRDCEENQYYCYVGNYGRFLLTSISISIVANGDQEATLKI